MASVPGLGGPGPLDGTPSEARRADEPAADGEAFRSTLAAARSAAGETKRETKRATPAADRSTEGSAATPEDAGDEEAGATVAAETDILGLLETPTPFWLLAPRPADSTVDAASVSGDGQAVAGVASAGWSILGAGQRGGERPLPGAPSASTGAVTSGQTADAAPMLAATTTPTQGLQASAPVTGSPANGVLVNGLPANGLVSGGPLAGEPSAGQPLTTVDGWRSVAASEADETLAALRLTSSAPSDADGAPTTASRLENAGDSGVLIGATPVVTDAAGAALVADGQLAEIEAIDLAAVLPTADEVATGEQSATFAGAGSGSPGDDRGRGGAASLPSAATIAPSTTAEAGFDLRIDEVGTAPRTTDDVERATAGEGIMVAGSAEDVAAVGGLTGPSGAGGAQTLGEAEAARAPLAGQLADGIELARQRPGQAVRIVLQPEGLGTVTVRVGTEQNGVNIQIGVDNPATRELVQATWGQLQQALDQRGLSVQALLVDSTDADLTGNGQADAGLTGGQAGRDTAGRQAGHQARSAGYGGTPRAEAASEPLGQPATDPTRRVDYRV